MKNSEKAWACGCLPGAALIANFMLYTFIHFVAGSLFSADSAGYSVVAVILKVVSILQSVLGVACIILIPVGFVFAIIYATKDGEPPKPPQSNHHTSSK